MTEPLMDMLTETGAPTIEARVKTLIVEHLGVEACKVVDTATFNELGADSLDQIELSMGFEEHFEIDIPDETVREIGNVGDVVKYIEGRLRSKSDLDCEHADHIKKYNQS